MSIIAEEGSTRGNIISLLKKNGGMSIEELSKVIDITPMGIRQHLLSLEKKGLVSYVVKKRGIGRPGFVYMLTDASNELFPKAYDSFALGLLRDIKKHEGQEKIDKIFGWRRERLLRHTKSILSSGGSIDARLQGLKGILEENGHLAEVTRNNGSYLLKQFHCPISRISAEFREACHQELELYRDLLGKNVTREQTIADGAPACIYKIPRS